MIPLKKIWGYWYQMCFTGFSRVFSEILQQLSHITSGATGHDSSGGGLQSRGGSTTPWDVDGDAHGEHIMNGYSYGYYYGYYMYCNTVIIKVIVMVAIMVISMMGLYCINGSTYVLFM